MEQKGSSAKLGKSSDRHTEFKVFHGKSYKTMSIRYYGGQQVAALHVIACHQGARVHEISLPNPRNLLNSSLGSTRQGRDLSKEMKWQLEGLRKANSGQEPAKNMQFYAVTATSLLAFTPAFELKLPFEVAASPLASPPSSS